MQGGNGNDTYVVDNVGDVIEEIANQGRDVVYSQINSYTLPDYVEDLVLVDESNARVGNGNELDNYISGNNYNNKLYGNEGNDTLDGYAGDNLMYGG